VIVQISRTNPCCPGQDDQEQDRVYPAKTAHFDHRSPSGPKGSRVNNANQRVAIFDYPRRHEADALAAQLRADKKITHFVQPVKEPIGEYMVLFHREL
jgi:hypothetical protein